MARGVMNLTVAWCIASYVTGAAILFFSMFSLSEFLLSPFWVPLLLVVQFFLIGNPELPADYRFFLIQLTTFGCVFVLAMVVICRLWSRYR